MKKRLLFSIMSLAAVYNLHALEYGCDTVFPKDVYCPDGYACMLEGTSCYFLSSLGKALSEETYTLPVQANEFVDLGTISSAKELNLEHLPAAGTHAAYRFTATDSDMSVPVELVIRTEKPTQEILDRIAPIITQENVEKVRNKDITLVYRRVPTMGETKFKIYHISPTDNAAEHKAKFVITPKGNLQKLSQGAKAGELGVVEIETGKILK